MIDILIVWDFFSFLIQIEVDSFFWDVFGALLIEQAIDSIKIFICVLTVLIKVKDLAISVNWDGWITEEQNTSKNDEGSDSQQCSIFEGFVEEPKDDRFGFDLYFSIESMLMKRLIWSLLMGRCGLMFHDMQFDV